MSLAPAPFGRPLYVMAKPAGSLCNLRCTYCYYLDKKRLYPGRPETLMMPDDVLEEFIRQYIEAQTTPRVMFTWHGGESMMRDLVFYKKVLRLQRRYARGIAVDNCIQTNGTLINDAWARFFKENGWLVGLSVDGPERFHNLYRRGAGGKGSFERVMRGIECLNRHGVAWNAMAVVNDANVEHPLEFYDFFRSIDCRYIQFTPIVERFAGDALAHPADRNAVLAPFSVDPAKWGDFLCAIFDEWVRHDVGTFFVQLFDATLANWVGVEPGICTLGRTCGHAAVVEHNGDLYSCDHFVFEPYRLGNIMQTGIFELMGSRRQTDFGLAKATLPGRCHRCQWLRLCNGECPKNRFVTTADGEDGLNYLCEGYRRFFERSAPAMRYMRDEIAARRTPASVMDAYARLYPDAAQ